MRSRRASISNTPEKPTDDPIRWLLTVSGRGWVLIQPLSPSVFIGRWTSKILFSLLFSLKERPYRHGQLRRQLGSVSQRMLTRTLRNLESAGLIARRGTQSKAIAVEYSLTQLGRTIIAPLRGMFRWAKRYRKVENAEVRLREAETG